MKIRSLFFLAVITVLLGVVTTCEEEPDSSGTVSFGNTPINVPGGTLTAKLQWLESNAVSNTNYIIEVANDEFINPQYLYFSGRSNITIQLKGIGGERVIQLNVNTESLFTIRNDVTLILKENIVLNGSTRNDMYLVTVVGGTFIMEGGKISNNSYGGVRINSGVFIMNGGKISGNRDSGVRVQNDGTLIMNSGEISGNKSSGVLIKSGIFTMNGGTITGNTGYGGGVDVISGTFTMNGGKISGNTGYDDYGNSYDGGGVSVSVSGTFIMTGGEISGNNSSYGGGGVYVEGGTFTMTDGEISGNNSSYGGGGAYVNGTFTMTGGEISGNTAYNYGGGVCVYYGLFEKTGGIITGYSSDNVNGNVVKDSDGNVLNDQGHAVVVVSRNYNSDPLHPIYEFSIMKRKDTTAGEQDNLSYVQIGENPPTISGAWDN